MVRVFSSLLLLLLIVTPSASADGFRAAEVRKELTTAGYGAIADRVADVSRPVLMLDRVLLAREPRALGTTRFGGRPDLPVGTQWPRCRGRQQAFLAQIRVRDIPPTARELRRHGGTLLFFMADASGDNWPARCAAVIHARRGATLARSAPPRGLFRLQPARMLLNLRPDVPDIAGNGDRLMAPLRDIRMTEADWERWYDVRNLLNGDPEYGHQLLGYSRGAFNPDTCTKRADRRTAPWRQLLMVDNDDELGFDIPDAGRLHVLIAPDALRTGRFDQICGYFDTT